MTEKKFIANHTTKNGHNFLNSSVQYFLKHFLNPSVQYCVAASLMKPFRLSPLDRKPFNLVENGPVLIWFPGKVEEEAKF